MCKEQGHIRGGTVADHIVRHAGSWSLFMDIANTQTLCKEHHDKAKALDEARGYSTAIGADGWPIDPAHPFNQGAKVEG